MAILTVLDQTSFLRRHTAGHKIAVFVFDTPVTRRRARDRVALTFQTTFFLATTSRDWKGLLGSFKKNSPLTAVYENNRIATTIIVLKRPLRPHIFSTFLP